MDQGQLNLLLGKLSRLHQRRCNTEFGKLSVTQGQPRILRYLKDNEGCIQRELCEQCHLEPATVTNILDKMESRELIERRLAPGNRRNQQVFLTPKGKESLTQVEETDRRLEKEFLTGFDAEDAAQAFLILDRICDNMISADNATHID